MFLTFIALAINTYSQEYRVEVNKTTNDFIIKLPVIDNDSLIENNKGCSSCQEIYGRRFEIKSTSDEWYKSKMDSFETFSLKIDAKEAKYLSLFFKDLKIPYGGTMTIENKDQKKVYNHIHTILGEKYKSYRIKGDYVKINFQIPINQASSFNTELSSITYEFKETSYMNSGVFSKLLTCHNDINCSDASSYRGLARATVHIRNLCDQNNNCGQCTGTIINNVRRDGKPYILTADHCIWNGVLNNEANIEFVLHHNSISCGGADLYPSSSDYTLVGADCRAHLDNVTGTGGEFVLFELYDQIPVQYNALYAGWDRRTALSLQGESVYGIHHPDGAAKKISYGIVNNNGVNLFGFIRVNYLDGTTEPGSSGSAIYTSDYRVVGQSSGGFSSTCSDLGNKYYGHFRDSWNNVLGSSQRLKDWLDPDNEDPDYITGYDPLFLWPTSRLLTGNFYRTDYYPDNTVEIKAADHIQLMGVTVYDHGSYIIKSGNTIELTYVVDFEEGCTVELIPGALSSKSYDE